METILRATTDGDDAWDDPSEDLIYELLTDVEQGNAEFLVVERTADRSGQTYIQALLNPDGSWRVEHRDGSPGEHFEATCPDVRAVHSLVVAWAFDASDWHSQVTWLPLATG